MCAAWPQRRPAHLHPRRRCSAWPPRSWGWRARPAACMACWPACAPGPAWLARTRRPRPPWPPEVPSGGGRWLPAAGPPVPEAGRKRSASPLTWQQCERGCRGCERRAPERAPPRAQAARRGQGGAAPRACLAARSLPVGYWALAAQGARPPTLRSGDDPSGDSKGQWNPFRYGVTAIGISVFCGRPEPLGICVGHAARWGARPLARGSGPAAAQRRGR
jgi:hypothetical protein